MNRRTILSTILSLTSLAQLACAPASEEELAAFDDEIRSTALEIKDGHNLTSGTPYGKATVGFPGSPGCTGTIIGKRHVLTAAHCPTVTPGAPVLLYQTNGGLSGSHARLARCTTPRE